MGPSQKETAQSEHSWGHSTLFEHAADRTNFTIAKDAELHGFFYDTKFSLVVGADPAALI